MGATSLLPGFAAVGLVRRTRRGAHPPAEDIDAVLANIQRGPVTRRHYRSAQTIEERLGLLHVDVDFAALLIDPLKHLETDNFFFDVNEHVLYIQ